jgi:hypothetical protein
MLRDARVLTKSTFRKVCLVGAVGVGLLASVTLPATPAFAAATGCSGLRVCMYLSTPSKGHVYIQGWADHVGTTGYMTLTGPNGLKSKSSTTYWKANKGNWEQWNNIPAVVGQYCVTLQQTDGFGSSWKACERIT